MSKTVQYQFRPRLPVAAQERIKKGGAHKNRKQYDRNALKRLERRGEFSSPSFREHEAVREF